MNRVDYEIERLEKLKKSFEQAEDISFNLKYYPRNNKLLLDIKKEIEYIENSLVMLRFIKSDGKDILIKDEG